MLYTYPPTQHTFYPRCVFKASTGLDCPGCGLTRASHAVLHGRFADAWRLNPLLYGPLAGSGAMRDITSGDNGGYAAGAGWDACTGWGVPIGSTLLAALEA